MKHLEKQIVLLILVLTTLWFKVGNSSRVYGKQDIPKKNVSYAKLMG